MMKFNKKSVYLWIMILGGLFMGSGTAFPQYPANVTVGSTVYNSADYTTPSFTELLRQYKANAEMTSVEADAILKEKDSPYNVVMSFYDDPKTKMAFNWYTNADVTAAGAYVVQIDVAGGDFTVPLKSVTSTGTLQANLPYNNETNDITITGDIPERGFIPDISLRSYLSHKALVEGLTPGTEYSFRVGNGTVWSDVGSFTTAPDNKNGFSFMLSSDPQGYRTSRFEDAQTVTHLGAAKNPDFWIVTGDLVESSDNDETPNAEWEWEQFFETQQDILNKLPLTPSVGNHDASPQLNFTSHFNTKRDQFGNFEFYGTRTPGSIYSYVYGDVLFFALNFEETLTVDQANEVQRIIQWMKEVANDPANKTKWRIAYFHQGMYPVAYTHMGDEVGMIVRTLMMPAFDELNIDLVIQGNDHVYSVIGPVKNYQLVEGAVSEVKEAPVDPIANAKGKKGGHYDVTDGTLYFVNGTSGTTSAYIPITEAQIDTKRDELGDNYLIPENYWDFFTGRYGQTTLLAEPDPNPENGDPTRCIASPTYSIMEVTADTIFITTYEVNLTGLGDAETVFDKIKVVKPNPGNNNLKSLNVMAGTLNHDLAPEFSPEVITYNVTVPNAVTDITLTAIAADPEAGLTGTGSKVLNMGDNSFEIEVTAQNGDLKTYTVNIRRISNNADLADLKVDNVLVDGFTPATPSYSVTVPFTTESINVTATTEDAKAQFLQSEGVQTGPGVYQLNVGSNNILIPVMAEHGNVKTYSISVSRTAIGTDANLSNITVSSGTLSPEFSPSVTAYTVEVENDVTSITVNAEPANAFATVVGTGVRDNLAVGPNVINLQVTAEDESQNQYTVTVQRKANGNTSLNTLTVTNGDFVYTLSPEFSPAQSDYELNVMNSVTSVLVTATAEAGTSSVEGTGTHLFDQAGAHVINLNVTAENGDVKTYTITVNRAASSNNSLIDLSITGYSLTPAFDPDRTDGYSALVGNQISIIYVTATKEDPTAKIMSGIGNHTLTVGDNTVNVVVNAEDGTPRTYTVNVVRAQSNDASLSSLTVRHGTDTWPLNPAFSPTVNTYNVYVGSSVDNITITATPISNVATATGSGTKTLTAGANPFNVKVTAEDGTTTKDYVITVHRAAANSADLTSLSVNRGTLTPSPFNPNTLNYTVSVPNTTSDITVTAIAVADATITRGNGTHTLKVGENKIEVAVTNNTSVVTKTYTITVTRASSTNADLSALSINPGAITPAFSPSVTEYAATVPNDITVVNVSATAVDNYTNRNISGTGPHALSEGENKIYVIPLSESGESKTYTITVTRALPPSSDATLASVSVDGNPATQNAEDNTIWEITVDFTESITIAAVANHSGATVTAAHLGTKPVEVGLNTFPVEVTSENGSVQTYSLKVTVNADDTDDPPTAAEYSPVQALQAYPNPASDRVIISGLNGSGILTVIDAAGRQWIRYNITSAEETVSVSALPQGTYLIQIVEGKTVRTVRIVVE